MQGMHDVAAALCLHLSEIDAAGVMEGIYDKILPGFLTKTSSQPGLSAMRRCLELLFRICLPRLVTHLETLDGYSFFLDQAGSYPLPILEPLIACTCMDHIHFLD